MGTKKSLFSLVFAEKIKQVPLPERLQEVFSLFGQGVDAPPATTSGRDKSSVPKVAEVFVGGRKRYAEPLRERVPVDRAPADFPQDALLRRADYTHVEPKWDSGTSHKWFITEKYDILKRW